MALLEGRFAAGRSKKKFSVSTQHYTFAINAFVEMVRKVCQGNGGVFRAVQRPADNAGAQGVAIEPFQQMYEFSILETRTYECVENVRDYKSELGILYLDDFNEKYLTKLFEENNLDSAGWRRKTSFWTAQLQSGPPAGRTAHRSGGRS